jgi:plastocyanin
MNTSLKYNKGFGAGGILVIFGIIVILGGFLYSGALKQEADLSDTSVQMEDEALIHENTDALPEIGLEDEMIQTDTGNGGEGDVVAIDITGKNFAFSQKEIRVKNGDRVRITFSSTDGFHDWVVDEFNASTERVSTGGTTSVEFTANKTGTFEYYCSVGNHRNQGMAGNLIVE